MTTVRVSPPTVSVCDVLEYAQALIEEHGWRQGERIPLNEDWPEVAKNGLSLHDGIGMACFVLSGEIGTEATPPRSRSENSKDFPLGHRSRKFGYTGTLRVAATETLAKHLPTGMTDITFNDNAANVDAVLKVLDTTIKEACDGN